MGQGWKVLYVVLTVLMIAGIVASMVSIAFERIESAHIAGIQSEAGASAACTASTAECGTHTAARRRGATGQAVVTVCQATACAAQAIALMR